MEILIRRVRSFAEEAERLGLNGLDFQHVAICRRRAWLHLRRISFATRNEHVRQGLVVAEASFRRDASVDGLMGLRPDRLDWTKRIVQEEKKSNSQMDASTLQTAFYAALLTAATGDIWSGAIHIVPKKRIVQLSLLDEMTNLELALIKLADLKTTPAIPDPTPQPVCSGCSANLLCHV